MAINTEVTPALDQVAAIAAACREYTMFEWGNQNLDPLVVDHAKGVHVYTADGRRLIDLNSVSVSVNIGHGDERVIEAVVKQAAKLSFASPYWATEVRAEVGQRLAEVTPPGLKKSFFTLAGSDANEAAIRTARLATGRRKILARRRAYHGATQGVLPLAGDPRRWMVEAGVGDIVRIPDPYHYRSLLPQDEAEFCAHVLAQTEEIIQLEGPHTIAAVIVEPITGSNGLIVPPKGWLRGLRDLCTKYGIIMICDEVMSGFGRTGTWFACDHEQVSPDIMTVAKGLTSSYLPLGACILSEELGEALQDVPFGSGLTYQSHALGLAAAKANLDIYESDGLIENSRLMGEYLRAGIHRLAERHPSIGDIRGVGLFNIVELVHDRDTRVELFPLVGPAHPELAEFQKVLADGGLIAGVRGPWLMANPPLCVTSDVLDEVLEVFDRALDVTDRLTSSAGAPPPPHTAVTYPSPWSPK